MLRNREKLCLGFVYKLIYSLYSLTLFQEEEAEKIFFVLQTCFSLLITFFPLGH